MIPQAILTAAGLTAGEVASSAASAFVLQELLDIASSGGSPRGIFQRFVAQYTANVVGSSRQDASLAYRQAKFWSQQSRYISQYDENSPLDRRIASVSYASQYDIDMRGQYRYQVSVDIVFPGESKPSLFYAYVYSNQQLTTAGATDQALELLWGRFSNMSKPQEAGGDLAGASVNASVTGFSRYEVEQ